MAALFDHEPTPVEVTRRLPVPPGARLRLAPCTMGAANQVIRCWHRHSKPINQKVLFAVRAVVGSDTVGVAILGLPVSRVLDDGLAVEVRRVCVADPAPRNACSILYGACCRAAAAIGYRVAYTYTTSDEDAREREGQRLRTWPLIDGRRVGTRRRARATPITTTRPFACAGAAISRLGRALDDERPQSVRGRAWRARALPNRTRLAERAGIALNGAAAARDHRRAVRNTCQGCGGPLPPLKQKWCSDRCRKRSYDLVCVDCGGRVSGTDPGKRRGREPRCKECAGFGVVWTRERVLAAIRGWHAEHGDPPGMMDWNPYAARRQLRDEARARRFEEADGRWPGSMTVVRLFGSWSGAICAAGLEPRTSARRRPLV